MNRLKEKYIKEAKPALIKEFDIKNTHAVPAIQKIVVNMGTKDILRNKGEAEKLRADLATITGQTPKTQKARLSVAGFNIREGMPVGLSVTLRRDRMYAFLDKLISIVLPRLRDFRGVSADSFDKSGNYSLGLREYSIFPEIDLAKVDRVQGLQITIVTNTKDKKQAKRLLQILGMPWQKNQK